jgi:Fur family peroxide stress response transcriptional regulator
MHRPPDRDARLLELERRCREAGTPFTVQRRAVLAAVVGRTDHPTADDVFGAVSAAMPGISRGTVYRTLETLVAMGLVNRVCHPGSAARYDGKTERHHHLVCDRCGAMVDLDHPGLDALPIPDVSASGFAVRDYSVQFRGLCGRCAGRAASP